MRDLKSQSIQFTLVIRDRTEEVYQRNSNLTPSADPVMDGVLTDGRELGR